MNLMDIKSKLDMSEKIDNLSRRVRKNSIISYYYDTLLEEVSLEWDDNLLYSSEDEMNFMSQYIRHCRSSRDSINNCSRYWNLDWYRLQGVKDITKISLCHNKFCDNCQNLLSVQRYEKYAPIIDELSRCFSIAHVVFTVPNVPGNTLKDTLDTMYREFKFVLRYLKGEAKIKGFDLEKYGFKGGIRSVEITKNKETGLFHPHFHCVFVFDKSFKINNNRHILNSFSFDKEHLKVAHRKGASKKDTVRWFTDFEVLLQKIWYLRMNGYKVNKINIESLEEGYSVICERTENVKEVFKYATKGIFKDVEQKDIYDTSYNDFKVLCYALYKRRIIQGFGCFWHCDFSESINQKAEGDKMYEEVISSLRFIESPEKMLSTLEEVLKEKNEKNVTYISRQNISAILEGVADD